MAVEYETLYECSSCDLGVGATSLMSPVIFATGSGPKSGAKP